MNNPLDFTGKVALVTGAAAGMGLATARAFAEAGAAVVLADFKEDAVNAEAEKLRGAGHQALAVRCDVSDDAQVAAMVERTVSAFGRLNAAFNNAGVMPHIAPTADIGPPLRYDPASPNWEPRKISAPVETALPMYVTVALSSKGASGRVWSPSFFTSSAMHFRAMCEG